jgi:hypothetical protein
MAPRYEIPGLVGRKTDFGEIKLLNEKSGLSGIFELLVEQLNLPEHEKNSALTAQMYAIYNRMADQHTQIVGSLGFSLDTGSDQILSIVAGPNIGSKNRRCLLSGGILPNGMLGNLNKPLICCQRGDLIFPDQGLFRPLNPSFSPEELEFEIRKYIKWR